MHRVPRLIAIALFACSCPYAGAAVPDNDELVSLVNRVVDTHPTVRAARAQLSAAETDVTANKLARLPSLTVESFSDSNAKNAVSNTIALEQPIWAGGRISASINYAKTLVDVARAGVDEASLNVALRTSDAYVEYLRLQSVAKILSEGVEQHQRLVDSIKRRVDQQVSPSSDLDYAVQRLLSIQQEQIQDRIGMQLALSRLRELSGDQELALKGWLYYSPDQPSLRTDNLLRAAIDYDPTQRRLRAEINAAEAETAVRKGQVWPQLNLQALHYSGGSYSVLKDRLGLVFRLQTDGGFGRLAAVRASAQREESARAAAEGGVRDVREKVVADLSDYSAASARIDAGRSAVTAASTVTESYLRQFTAGRRTWPEVLNAVREEVMARVNEVNVQASAMATGLRLQLRSGQWRPGESVAPAVTKEVLP